MRVYTVLICLFSTMPWAIACSNDSGTPTSRCKADESEATVDLGDAIISDAGPDASDGMDAGDVSDAGDTAAIDFTGLYCFAYNTLGERKYRLSVINYWADCGGPAELAVAERSDEGASLAVIVRNCGSGCFCPHDFSVEVEDVGSDGMLKMTVDRTACLTWETVSSESVTFSTAEMSDGMICQYMGAFFGGRHAPCRRDGTCDSGLICSESETLSGPMDVCLLPCDTAADCPVPSVFQCVDDACHVIPGMTQQLR